jgi:molybdopterin-guanine dinucleotide biosynthesis protein A
MMNSVVLAGGKGVRLGRDKLSEPVGGHPLLQRVIDVLALVSDQILVVIAQRQHDPALLATTKATRIIADFYPGGKGALGGIYTGLAASVSSHSLVVAGDMPFLSSSLLHYLMEISPNFDVVMPRVKGEIEPLHAIYSRNCLEPIRQQIEQGDLRIRGFFQQVKVRYVEEEEIDRFDPRHLSFFNINTPADLRKAKVLLEEFDNT